jgi:hypothetical protein
LIGSVQGRSKGVEKGGTGGEEGRCVGVLVRSQDWRGRRERRRGKRLKRGVDEEIDKEVEKAYWYREDLSA